MTRLPKPTAVRDEVGGLTPGQRNAWVKSCPVGHSGIEVTQVLPGELHTEFTVGPE